MSMLFSRISEWVDSHLGGGAEDSKIRYVLIGLLVLIIGGCLAIIIGSLVGPGSSGRVARDAHFWCLETNKEFVFKPGEIPVEERMHLDMAEPYGGIRMKNPETGRQTLIPMSWCPACEKHFVTEAQKRAVPDRPMDPRAFDRPVCTHCNTDIFTWYRERSKKKK